MFSLLFRAPAPRLTGRPGLDSVARTFPNARTSASATPEHLTGHRADCGSSAQYRLALLPHRRDRVLRTPGYRAVPHHLPEDESSRSSNTSTRAAVVLKNTQLGQGPSRYLQPLQPRLQRASPDDAHRRTGGPLSSNPRASRWIEKWSFVRQEGEELRSRTTPRTSFAGTAPTTWRSTRSTGWLSSVVPG